MPKRKKQSRNMIRMAVLLHQRLSGAGKPVSLLLPETEWRECQRLGRLHEKAINKGWLAAAQRIRPRLEQALRELQACLTQTLTNQNQKPVVSPSLRELYKELLGLYGEYPNADCNLRSKTISVITDSITLEDVDLGAFCIELDANSTNGLSYSVIATDPNPAGNDEDVTHPHVRDNCLCEGEGTLPIRNALAEGRLGDFFQIVDQVLQTYNGGSAYVALDEWQGISCTACGEYVNDDERTSCSRTCDPLCCECAETCSDCDQDFCPDLVERCHRCEENFCDRCLDEGICNACQQETRDEEVQSEQQTETPLGGCGGHSVSVEHPSPVVSSLG